MNELAQAHTYFDKLRRNNDARFYNLECRIKKDWKLDNSDFYQLLCNWFSLFQVADRELALRLLLELDYYDESRLENEFKLRLQSLEYMDVHLNGPYQNALVVMPDNKVDSAYRHSWLISKLKGINGKQMVDIDTLTPELIDNRYLVFINDTHGSGNQFLQVIWSKLESKGVDPKKVVILAIAIANAAQKLFRNKGFVLIPDDDAKSAYQIFNREEMTHIEALCQKLEPTYPLGYGGTALLVAYHFQCPNNTLPLIWSSGNARFPWNPLFKYRQKTKPATNESNRLKSSVLAQTLMSKRPNLEHLPSGARNFLGRDTELKLLDDAWTNAGHTQMVELVATSGVGKTSLVRRWLDLLKINNWRGAQWVYGWCFFNQPSDNDFLDDALHWFEVEHDPALPFSEKGKLLAEAVATKRSLLVLDGVDSLQYPPGPKARALCPPASGLKELLIQLASGGQQGLCLLTTKERIRDLEEYERSAEHPMGTLVLHDLGNLSDSDGARLLYNLGVQHAGAATISPDDVELKRASREIHGHAFTLSLLGSYLAHAYEGDIRQRDKVDLEEADESEDGNAFKIMAAYETWFQQHGKQGARELAALRLLGFFDRPADSECLAVLRAAPPIRGLTKPLVNLNTTEWNISLSRLEECGLIKKAPLDSLTIDVHYLMRKYLAKTLREHRPKAWREGHRRLFEYLTNSVPYCPEGLVKLQPLYQAIYHGCQAGLQPKAFQNVYVDRILRGTGPNGFYSGKKLGALGANLGAVACFFDDPWEKVSSNLWLKDDQAWLLNEAAYLLSALGRLSEALVPMRAAINKVRDLKNTSIYLSNVSELELALGHAKEAVRDAEYSMMFAPVDIFQYIVSSTTLADALHQQGERDKALELFVDAELMQANFQPYHGLLYSVPGFRYCDLLLAGAERAAWQLQLAFSSFEGEERDKNIDACHQVYERVAQTIKWEGGRLYDIALDHLNLSRSALIKSVLENSALKKADYEELSTALAGFYAASVQQYIPLCILTRAWFHAITKEPEAARADLDEAWQIASRNGMSLAMADIRLYRARLFHDQEELQKARELIQKYSYWRRKEELEDAEQAAKKWIGSPSP
jgi:hypothetical protein